MDFDFNPSEQQFRKDLRQMLKEELPDWWIGEYNKDQKAFDVTLRVADRMGKNGWLTAHWPKEYGGQDQPMWHQVVMREEMWANKEPRGPQYMSTNWIGPSILMYGTEEQKKLHLTNISQGKSLWAQGFSEPDAGSDLASLKTRAIRDGDEYVINGEKIWTSHTPHAEWIFLLTRSDPDAPKHKGISVFLLPINLPGIRIVPIKSMVGYGEFAHVFFEDVRVPASMRLGEENRGWDVTVTALKNERLGAPRFITSFRQLYALIDFAKSAVRNGRALWDDPVVRQRFGELWTLAEVGRLLYYRNVSLIEKGEDSNLFGPLARLGGTVANQLIPNFGLELLGDDGELDEVEDAPFHGKWPDYWRSGITATIAAGTTEINKNTLATRGLGLPR